MNEQELKEQIKQEVKEEMKKSRRKRIKIFLIILIILLILIIIGVLAFAITKINKRDKKDTIYTIDTEDTGMTKEEFAQYVTAVPVTTENWSEYIELEDKTSESTNAFGEITRKTIQTVIKSKDNVYYYDVVLKIESENLIGIGTINDTTISEFTSAGQILFNNNNKSTESNVFDYTVTLDDLECTRAEGTVFVLDLPEEEWQIDSSGAEYIRIDNRTYYKSNDAIMTSLCGEVTNTET